MIRRVVYTSQFKRDIKKIVKQGKDFIELESIIEVLVKGGALATKYREHTCLVIGLGIWSVILGPIGC